MKRGTVLVNKCFLCNKENKPKTILFFGVLKLEGYMIQLSTFLIFTRFFVAPSRMREIIVLPYTPVIFQVSWKGKNNRGIEILHPLLFLFETTDFGPFLFGLRLSPFRIVLIFYLFIFERIVNLL